MVKENNRVDRARVKLFRVLVGQLQLLGSRKFLLARVQLPGLLIGLGHVVEHGMLVWHWLAGYLDGRVGKLEAWIPRFMTTSVYFLVPQGQKEIAMLAPLSRGRCGIDTRDRMWC